VPRRNQKRFPVCLMVVALALLALRCEIEDEIRIHRDGSGTYRAKMLVEKQFASAIPDIRKDAVKAGLRIVEEGETETRHFIVMARDFKNINEIGDSQNRMSFTVSKAGWLRERYEFSASLPSSTGFSRQLTIVLPAPIERNTAGEARGNTIVWDCTKGGALEVTAAGLVLPLAVRSPTILGLIALAVAAGIVLLVLRRRPAAKLHCATCGATKSSGAHYCTNCGTADAVPGIERSGG
jgi:hypothetical protein